MMLEALNEKLFDKKSPVTNSFMLMIDDIGPEVAKEAIQFIIESNFISESKPDVLNMIVCSPGGELAAAWAIIDVMRSSEIPIRTIGLGEICSAGLMIFLAGTKGHRILTPNTSIMSHRFSGGSNGKLQELFAIQKEFDLTSGRMIDHYKRTTGLSEKDIHKYLLPPEDVYLSAKEALKFGICDKVALL